jgi:hypothetical protein
VENGSSVPSRYLSKRLAGVGLVAALLAGTGLLMWRSSSPKPKLACGGLGVDLLTSPAECMTNLMVAASFDALSPAAKAAAIRQQDSDNIFSKSLGGRGFVYRVDEEGQFRATSKDGSIGEALDFRYFGTTGTTTEEKGIRAFQDRIIELGKQQRSSPKPRKRSKPNCDPNRLEALTGMSEERLRSCLRSMFLLHNRSEFNEATQALFKAADKFRYADGQDGPLSFTYKGANDDDRSEIVKIIRSIDKQAHDQGGLR